jgi:pimeloyl-ACP methyl ester carboxylesterase
MATFVLIHGACHRGSCWDATAAALRERGHDVLAPDLPSDDPECGLDTYTDVVTAALPDTDGSLVFVGHSLGALTATTAASRAIEAGRPVVGLSFVAGIVPLPGHSLADLAEADADRDLPMGDDALTMFDNGTFQFTGPAAIRLLYNDLDPAAAAEAVAQLRPQRSLWADVVDVPRWPETNLQSIVGERDLLVNPSWSKRIARERLGLEADVLDTGHSPMLSQPSVLADLLSGDARFA